MSVNMYKKPTQPTGRRVLRLVIVAAASLACLSVRAEPQDAGAATAPVQCTHPKSHLQGHVSEALASLHAHTNAVDIWSQQGRLETLVSELDALVYDGLPPLRYQLVALREARDLVREQQPLTPCQAELASMSFLRALSDLYYGKLRPGELGLIWYAPDLQVTRDAQTLMRLANLGVDVTASFTAARPTLPRYQHLRDAYRKALEHLPDNWPELTAGPSLQQGDTGPRVQLLRERLNAQGYWAGEPAEQSQTLVFDAGLTQAVQAFQQDHQLDIDGVVGRQTLAQLRIPPATRLAEIRANLERFRWLARDVEPDMVLVDIAGASIEHYQQGQQVWSGKTQVGRPRRPTPRLKSLITHVTVNPAWTVPPTVLYEDIVPAVSLAPTYLTTHRIRVFTSNGVEVDPAEVNWNNPTGILLRQDPGPHNALGQVAIRFSNPFSVYLHDTPSRHLFLSANRFYSSGCVRIEEATALTSQLFQEAGRLPQFEAALSTAENRNVTLERRLPVVMAYWTAQATETGTISFRADQYDANTQLIDLLDNSL